MMATTGPAAFLTAALSAVLLLPSLPGPAFAADRPADGRQRTGSSLAIARSRIAALTEQLDGAYAGTASGRPETLRETARPVFEAARSAPPAVFAGRLDQFRDVPAPPAPRRSFAAGAVPNLYAAEEKKEEKKDEKPAPPTSKGAVAGAALGMTLLAVIGFALGGPIGAAIGILAGVFIGALIGRILTRGR